MDRVPRRPKAECLALAFVITLAWLAVPDWGTAISWSHVARALDRAGYAPTSTVWQAVWGNYGFSLSLLFALCLVLPSPKRFGLRIGRVRGHRIDLLLICGVPLLVCWVGCQFVALPSWLGGPVGGWLISPLAQDLVFVGFLSVLIEESFPGDVHPRVPMRQAVPIMAAYFSLWHVPNFQAAPASFVWLQLGYTYIVGVLMGLSRQWTGSILYATATHSAGNWIAWRCAGG